VWVRSAEGRVSTLDLLSPGLTLLTGPDSVPSEAQAGGGPPVAVRRLDAVSARAIGIRGRGALLVRPDGTPARLWTHEATVAA
jgi:putative polyketide hydroxylase